MVNLDYLYNPAAAKSSFDKNYFVDKKLVFQSIENGMILPHKDTSTPGKRTWGAGGIIDGKGEYIRSSHVGAGVGESYTPQKESIKYSNETVVYLGLFFPVWGHIITDNIRRLWFLKSEIFKSEFKNCPLVYIAWTKRPLESQPNFRRLLEILEIDVDKIKSITQPTKFERIILPDESFYYDKGRYFTEEYRETIDQVRNFALKNRTPTSSKKIYYFYGKNQVGEERLAEYFRSKGYEIIRPEKLILDEQLNLLINCESFASTLGSCAHNSIFLRDNIETILIPRSANAFTGYQQTLDQVHPINAHYVDSSLSIFNVRHDCFCYIISEQLKRFFKDNSDGYEEENFKTFLEYVKFGIHKKGRSINPGEKNAYGAIFSNFMSQLKQHEDLIAAYDMPLHWETFQPSLTYQTHVAKKGWSAWLVENQISNDIEKQLRIEALKINLPNHKIYYAVYYNDKEGWSEEVTNSEPAGTTGKAKPIMGIRIRLDEEGAKEFDILYRVHKFDGTWTDWAKNGEIIRSHGQQLNAIQIKLNLK